MFGYNRNKYNTIGYVNTQRVKSLSGDNQSKMRLVVQLSDEVHKRLIEYVQRRYKGKHGSLSWVAEEAIEKFLNEEAKREKREAS